MFYKILNYFLEKKIAKLRPAVKRFLSHDLQEQKDTREKIINKDMIVSRVYYDGTEHIDKNIQTILKRIEVEHQYILLFDYFKNDTKRKYMINSNFYKFLEAIKYLYSTSSISISVGVLTAPAEIYYAINAVEDCFNEAMSIYKLSKPN